MQESEVKTLTTDEIKRMLLATINNDTYTTKCFIDLILKMRDNSIEELEILEEAKKLLSELKTKEAAQLINKL